MDAFFISLDTQEAALPDEETLATMDLLFGHPNHQHPAPVAPATATTQPGMDAVLQAPYPQQVPSPQQYGAQPAYGATSPQTGHGAVPLQQYDSQLGYGAPPPQPRYGPQYGYYGGLPQFNQTYGNTAQGVPKQVPQGPVTYPIHQQIQPPLRQLQYGSPVPPYGVTDPTVKPPVQSKQRGRASKACDRCSNSKQKCEANADEYSFPCARCVTSGRDCVVTDRRGRPEMPTGQQASSTTYRVSQKYSVGENAPVKKGIVWLLSVSMKDVEIQAATCTTIGDLVQEYRNRYHDVLGPDTIISLYYREFPSELLDEDETLEELYLADGGILHVKLRWPVPDGIRPVVD